MDKKEKQAQRAKQEDEILNKVLWWIVASVLLEMLLLLLNKVYVNYTVDQIDLAVALREDVFPKLAIILPICFVVMLVLWLAARKSGRLVRQCCGSTARKRRRCWDWRCARWWSGSLTTAASSSSMWRSPRWRCWP